MIQLKVLFYFYFFVECGEECVSYLTIVFSLVVGTNYKTSSNKKRKLSFFE